ncbi:Serine/threonine-protein phosphatase [Giardia muris]|uniref:Serine/threonine-protein phosphatase n=1 Tax=Giardia muris TaxID=5742 RepID=A0A4Z1SUW3_GIAMU|nr:Serine/threonine-protein phosphatase [Giardia muris]|eukprot:TNJ29604.1 Serine/threonine-protein phosphatase [Giardia muris]
MLLLAVAYAALHVYHMSDDHGWIGGHTHETDASADYALVNYFVEQRCHQHRQAGDDCLFFNSGDFIQGSGLSDAGTPIGTFVYDILSLTSYDAITVGNHDISVEGTTDWVQRMLTKLLGERLVTTNVIVEESIGSHLLGSPYRVLDLPQSGIRVVVIGLLHQRAGADGVYATDPALLYKDPLFQEIVDLLPEMVIVLFHQGYDTDPNSFNAIRTSFRASLPPRTPIIFLGGHEHKQLWVYPFQDPEEGEEDFDALVSEPGYHARFISHLTIVPEAKGQGLRRAQKTDIPTDPTVLEDILGEPFKRFPDPSARRIQERFKLYSRGLDLGRILGIAPRTYEWPSTPTLSDGVWSLWLSEIIPTVLYPLDPTPLKAHEYCYISGSSFLPNGIFKGPVTLDDTYAFMPYTNERFIVFRAIPGDVLVQVYEYLSKSRKAHRDGMVPYYIWPLPQNLKSGELYDIVVVEYDSSAVQKALEAFGVDVSPEIFTDLDAHDVFVRFVKAHWQDE